MKKKVLILFIIVLFFISCQQDPEYVVINFEGLLDDQIELDEFESNDLSSDAILINPATIQDKKLSFNTKDTIDWYYFDAVKDHYYKFYAFSLQDYEMVINIKIYNTDFEDMTEYYSNYKCPQDGPFYIQVTNVNERKTGYYQLVILEKDGVPEAPDHFSVANSSDFISISWFKSFGAESYAVYRSEQMNDNFILLDVYTTESSEVSISSTVESLVFDKSCVPGTVYYYKVAALNPNGSSGFSEVLSTYRYEISQDVFEIDNTFADASLFTVGEENRQLHTIDTTADVDYISFYAEEGESYTIENVYQGYNSVYLFFTLYNSSYQVLDCSIKKGGMSYVNNTILGHWYCPSDGLYYLKLENLNRRTGNYQIELINE